MFYQESVKKESRNHQGVPMISYDCHGVGILVSGEKMTAAKSAGETAASDSRDADGRERRAATFRNRFRRWFYEGIRYQAKPAPVHQDSWWKVMCLTGVDYFSTLGYQPGIAFLAAGLLAPWATLIVVLITLLGLVPLYSRVAKESPHGQGSISMLADLVPGWRGKTVILVLLGFAATGFIITITLSAADATAHIIQNPIWPEWAKNRMAITMAMLTGLGALFLLGFREAISVAVAIVALYLVCNGIVVGDACWEVAKHPELISHWQTGLVEQYKSWPLMLGLSLLYFPKLALGMSGFETGVAVMPLVRGEPDDDPEKPMGRIKNARKLLLTAALIMSVFLLLSGLVTTVLIEPALFKEGGAANGRALAYLAHTLLGEGMGTVYDISTIFILWFAGASAIAGLLTLVPKYLPKFGMAPEWTRAQRPLVTFFIFISYIVTIIFKADVDAQAGAYATGILVLFTSAALAVLIVSWNEGLHKRVLFSIILAIFVYTSITNMIERPEGLQIASFFIGTILISSLVSRSVRSLELRVHAVQFDEAAKQAVQELLADKGQICLLAHRPGGMEYSAKEAETRNIHKLTKEEATFLFLEVTLTDPSEFGDHCLDVTGHTVDGVKVLRCSSAAIPNAIASILFHLRDETGTVPHAYFGWTEGHPLAYVFKYVFLGEGETAPVLREILRRVEHNIERRPRIIVG